MWFVHVKTSFASGPLEFKWINVKTSEFDEVLKIIECCHIFGITETHILPSNGKQLAGYKDFHYFRKNGERKSYSSGELLVYIRDEVSVIHGETPDYIWVEMDKNFFHLEENIYISFVYNARGNSSINDIGDVSHMYLSKKTFHHFWCKG